MSVIAPIKQEFFALPTYIIVLCPVVVETINVELISLFNILHVGCIEPLNVNLMDTIYYYTWNNLKMLNKESCNIISYISISVYICFSNHIANIHFMILGILYNLRVSLYEANGISYGQNTMRKCTPKIIATC